MPTKPVAYEWRRLDRRSVCLVVAVVMAYLASLRIEGLSGTLRVLFPIPGVTIPVTLVRLEIIGLVVAGCQVAATLLAGWEMTAPQSWSHVGLVGVLSLACIANVGSVIIGRVGPPHPVTPYVLAAIFHGTLTGVVLASRMPRQRET